MQVIEIELLNQPTLVYANPNPQFEINSKVVVSNNGSLELGTIKQITDKSFLDKPTDKQDNLLVEIVRTATQQDMLANCENCKASRALLAEIKQETEKLKLDMKVSFVVYALDKSKLIINYTSDDRVDFRELVKLLASKYHTRIEMRQIGNRDETKQIGAIGVCGRVTCCKAFLDDFDKVSIKMAKNQNIALNPNRINGMCGRLLCCLKYEDDFYEEMQKKMPRIKSNVNTPDGVGQVIATDFLKENVTVSFQKDAETTETKTYNLTEISPAHKDKN